MRLSELTNGRRAPGQIINYFSDGGKTTYNLNDSDGKNIGSGVTTANVLKSVLSVSGAGRISRMYVRNSSGATQDVRIRVTLDGNVCFDASAECPSSYGICVIGEKDNNDSVYFRSDMSVEIATGTSGTDSATLVIAYETY